MLLRSLSVLECLVCGPLEDLSFWCDVRDRFFIAERSQSCPKVFGGPAKLSQPIAITENRVALMDELHYGEQPFPLVSVQTAHGVV